MSPPPPMYPQVPAYGSLATISSFIAGPSNAAASAHAKPVGFPIITNPQTFSMPLGPPSTAPQASQYPNTYAPAAPQVQGQAQFSTVPYYAPSYNGSSYVPISSAAPTIMTTPQPALQGQPPGMMSNAGSQGAWTDEEQERLKELAEGSKSAAGNIDWDKVVREWGPTRTR